MWTDKESELEALKRRLDKAKNERHTATMPYILKIEINEEMEKQELLTNACRAIWSEETLKKKIAEVKASAAKCQQRQDETLRLCPPELQTELAKKLEAPSDSSNSEFMEDESSSNWWTWRNNVIKISSPT